MSRLINILSVCEVITILPIRAPEIIEHDGQYYISDLADFKGIKLAKLTWQDNSEQ